MNNIWLTWGDVFNASLQNLWWGLVQFTPKIVIAILFFIVGWVLGNVLAKALEQVFSALRIDKLFASVGAENFLRKAGMNLNTGRFVGQIAKWFVVVVFLLPSLSLVGLDYIASFLKDDVLGFLPRIFAAALVLIIATIISEATSKAIVAGAKSMSLTSAHFLGAVTKYSIWIFALIIALGQIGIAEYYMSVLFTGIIAMLSLGGALAFGLGGKDAASRFISKLGDEVSHK